MRPSVNLSAPCSWCYVSAAVGSAGTWGGGWRVGGEAGEGVSALDFSSRPRVALVTVCHPGINIIVRGQTHNPTEIAL